VQFLLVFATMMPAPTAELALPAAFLCVSSPLPGAALSAYTALSSILHLHRI
jgi:hypothetical protein